MNIRRREFVGSTLAASMLPTTLLAQSTAPIIRINLIPLVDTVPIYAAIENGYFKAEGFDAVLTPSTGGAVGVPGLIAGAFDIVYSNNVSALLASERGLDVRILGTALELQNDRAGIVARKEDNLRPGKGLEGKTIGVNTRNNTIWLYAWSWVKENGGDPDKVVWKEVPFPHMVDAIRQKQVDGAFVLDPFMSVAMGDPSLTVIGRPYDIQPKIQVGLYVCTGKTLRENPKMISAFLKAHKRGNEWYDAHRGKPELDKLIADFTKMSPDLVAKTPKPPTVALSMDQLRQTMDRMLQAKLLKAPLDLTKIVYTG